LSTYLTSLLVCVTVALTACGSNGPQPAGAPNGKLVSTIYQGRILVGIEAAGVGTIALAYIDTGGLHVVPMAHDGTLAHPAWAPDGTIVFSSDTNYNPKLAEFAKDADVLVHECLYVPAVDRLVNKTKNGATLKKHLLESHTTTEDVGRIAAAADVKVLVMSHFVPGDDPLVTDDNWTEDVKKNYSGRIIVAKDLMELKLPV